MAQHRRRRDLRPGLRRHVRRVPRPRPWPFIPRTIRVLYLGSELGLFRSDDGADNWLRVESPLNGMQVWSILLVAGPPDVILVGTCPSRLFRSEDGGRTWTEPTIAIRPDCPRDHRASPHWPAHARNRETMWAGVEIDGVFRSRDAGRTWHSVGVGLSSQDIHALTHLHPPRPPLTRGDGGVADRDHQ